MSTPTPVSRMSGPASAILLCALMSSVSASILQWHQVAPVPPSDRPVPETRYSHCAVVIDAKMYVTHGYFFDMSTNEASWLHNTWEFNFGTKAWSQIDTERYSVPLARYGATCNEFEGNLYFHGGDDGGNSKGLRSYVHTFFSDMWVFKPAAGYWSQLIKNDVCTPTKFAQAPHSISGVINRLLNDASTGQCSPRVAHGASVVVGKSLFTLFGLFQASPEEEKRTQRNIVASAAVWRYSFQHNTWHKAELSSDNGHFPEERYAVAAAAFSDKIFAFGGYSLESSSNFNDLWVLDLGRYAWLKLLPSPGASWPSARGYHSMLVSEYSLFLFGGARCTPGCVCSNDLWTLPLKSAHSDIRKYVMSLNSTHSSQALASPSVSWTLLERDSQVGIASREPTTVLKTLDWPVHRYRQSMLSVNIDEHQHLVVFGGESYRPSAYYRDVWTLDVSTIQNSITRAEKSEFEQAAVDISNSEPTVHAFPILHQLAPIVIVALIIYLLRTLCVRSRKLKQ